MEGFYVMYYTGVLGFGHAVLILKDGTVCGADAVGGTYDGNYVAVDQGIKFEATLVVPGGATLVTGQTLTEPLRTNIDGQLAETFADGQPVPIQTQLGPVNVIFKKLRELT